MTTIIASFVDASTRPLLGSGPLRHPVALGHWPGGVGGMLAGGAAAAVAMYDSWSLWSSSWVLWSWKV
ncbi:hypothetical protein Ahy_A02g009225 isoform G [Arachis hypogaea]|uniref:Uncharacterized protein n=1 Tax=Arachis hypogaea TaxID=3818 RepID=A0A445EGL6_ARAHY|nr:hypothetical protein Ahy_A02g009225 isoform G [Arachis hypogaea]